MSESTELAPHQGGGGAVMPASESSQRFSQMLTMIREGMLNPDVDANKAMVMKEMMVDLEDRSLRAEFNRDLNAAIMDMPVITRAGIIIIQGKNGEADRSQGRFARFEDIDRVVRPILKRNRLSIRFEVDENGQQITVRPILGHDNGYTERGGAMRLPLDTSGGKNNVQGAGSAVTYGKRYAMCAALNIVTEGTDDDGSLGKLAIGMPHEREVTVLEQAEEAHRAGNYPAWYLTQSPKDRAWLVSSGHHATLGGAPALPDASRGVATAPAAGGEQRQERQPEQRMTARQWIENYERLCASAGSIDELLAVQADAADDITRLQKSHPALHQRAVDAGTQALARLNGGDA